jgi:hypothetical protein
MIHWVNPSTGERVRFIEPYLSDGATVALNSFVNHSFIIEELADSNETTATCSNMGHNCNHFQQMTVRENDDQGKERTRLYFTRNIMSTWKLTKNLCCSGCY